MRVIALPCTLLVLCVPAVHAADSQFSVTLGADFSSGYYGSPTKTETWAVPLSLKYRTGDWNFRLPTAWLHVQGNGSVTPEGGPINAAGNGVTTEGMGDLTARVTYNLLDERSNWVGLDLSGKIKFGTASESKALGTGKNDYSLQAGFFKPIDNWAPLWASVTSGKAAQPASTTAMSGWILSAQITGSHQLFHSAAVTTGSKRSRQPVPRPARPCST
jgi:hypothetical protein